jgi:hypothetical protein
MTARDNVRTALMCLLLLGLFSFAGVVSAAPVTIPLSSFVIFSGGGATPDSQTNYETAVGGHTTINGNIGSNQDFYMVGGQDGSGSAQINGSVYVGGYLNMGQPLTVGSPSGPLRDIVVNGEDDGNTPDNAYEADFAGDLAGNMYVTSEYMGDTVHLGTTGHISQVVGFGGNLEFTGEAGSTDAIAGGNVEGTVTSPSSKTFALITMPSATDLSGFVVTQGNPHNPVTLLPNTILTGYGTLTTSQNQTVNLQSGDYYFQSIDMLGGLTVNIDLTSGSPINIYVVDGVMLKLTELRVKGAGTGGAFLPISDPAAQPLAGLIYLETRGIFDMRGASETNRNLWGGTVYASVREESGGEVNIGQYQDWYGAVWAFDSVDIADHGNWNLPTFNPTAIQLTGLRARADRSAAQVLVLMALSLVAIAAAARLRQWA